MRAATAVVGVLVGLLGVSGCGARPTTSAHPRSSSPATAAATPGQRRRSQVPLPSAGPASSSPAVATVTKLLVFVVENHSLDQMRSAMPFTRGLAERYGYADHYEAITHPSLPNYLAIAGGDTFGIRDDGSPAAHPLGGASIFGRALRHGGTARLYAESMGRPCQTVPAGDYAVKHNPWAYFAEETALCRRDDVSFSSFGSDVARGDLPEIGMVVPDLCDDAHDCALSRADAWLRSAVGRAMSGPDWASGHLAIVITADEDDNHHGNRILTVVAHPALHHVVVSRPLSHDALSRAYAAVARVAPLRHAAEAPDLLEAFGLAAA
ncbi:alkaline phosphatase family protein [Nocardioides sp. BP30]|uniref:alkaline phosphatase family protein n=1 Tax=Nocardioides sp. BP30 TaxID=3036374 RepID=UPI0024699389|nr:alkaline phosphatase family protein [Nocardioides sp. BP30]WGL53979.1 alkaline phosphatase family protein [Nocardioides sp. BP30]